MGEVRVGPSRFELTPAERVRRLLDERGVKYQRTVVTNGELFTVSTKDEYFFILVRDNDAGIEMWSQYFTPEQAIAATVGPVRCKDCKYAHTNVGDRHCKWCNYPHFDADFFCGFGEVRQ